MKLLLVGNCEGWMEIHLGQMKRGFEAAGAEVELVDYHGLESSWGFLRGEAGRFEACQRRLEKLVRSCKPDLILFIIARHRFDFARIRSYSRARIVLWDYDGPNWKCLQTKEWLKEIDLLLTVSRPIERELLASGAPVRYLPHGVDCDYYSPGPAAVEYRSPVSCVGRATARRAEFCREIADCGLALYGRRWHKLPECAGTMLAESVRTRHDVIGPGMVDIYRGADVLINILQENLARAKTIMSLQVFAIPAAGSCLVTERVEELAESFEIGRELLAFDTPEELAEGVRRALAEPGWARKVGEAGRERCLAQHGHRKRAETILDWLQ